MFCFAMIMLFSTDRRTSRNSSDLFRWLFRFSERKTEAGETEIQIHIDRLLEYRKLSRNNPKFKNSGKISEKEFLEALELLIASKRPSLVAEHWDLSPFMPFNGDPTALGEQWNISRDKAADTLWKIENDEPIEPWECTFARFEYAVIKEAVKKYQQEVSSANQEIEGIKRTLTILFIATAIIITATLLWGSSRVIGLIATEVILFLFVGGIYAFGWLKFFREKRQLKTKMSDSRKYLDDISKLIAKVNCA